ncbi:MAG: hypothetical protein JW819_03045 [Candidatus Krumholzibacteriota bacterium]|nr:hypothetical protein [Candidatus Krumholzibacteriota bacterium]
MRRVPSRLLALFLCLLPILPLTASPAGAARHPGPAADLDARVAATLARHLDGAAIGAWLATLSAGSLERDAAEWILAWLPPADCARVDLALLREHVELAAASYREAPWRERLPRELWLRFVVPHRVSQEPAQAWRRPFHDALWPRVRDLPTMEHAVLEVNRWCREGCTFTSTSGRDMGPLTTLKRGLGRCEEEMILTISALRSVGLPARSCATPYWTFTDNNHAWVEAWADGGWHYLGGCEPDRALDRAWFTGAARRAGFVRSVAYGEFDPAPEPLYRAEHGATLINSTRVYTEPITLTAAVAGGGDLWINVLNFGSLRPIARLASGGSIELGPGEYALTADHGGALLLETVRGGPGARVRATLDADDAYDLAASPAFWLRYPESDAPPRAERDLSDAETERRHRLDMRAREEDRARLRTLNDREREVLAGLDPAARERLEAVLEKPLERVSTIFLLLDGYGEEPGRAALLDLLAMADDKDLLELDARDLRSHVDGALAARERLAPLGLAMPDSIFREGLLACRIDREPGGAWREGLPLVPLAGTSEASLAAVLAAFRERMRETVTGFFGNPLPPDEAWALGLGSARDLATALVGLLRRNGFPARVRFGIVETWLGDWRRLDPVAGRLAAESPGAAPAGRGRLDITITRGGLPWERAEPYRHFMVTRLEDGWLESPWWDVATGEQDWDAGDYVLCSVLRVPGGSATGRLRAFAVRGGDTTRVTLPVDADARAWDAAGALLAGPEPARVLAVLAGAPLARHAPDAGGTPGEGGGAAPPAAGLFVLFEPGEPAARMITALGGVGPRLAAAGLSLVPVMTGPSGQAEAWQARLAEAGLPTVLWTDTGGALDALRDGDGAFAPLLMLRDPGSEVILLRRGFDAAADEMVHLALDVLAAR